MYFRITSVSVELMEPGDVTSFHAVGPAELRQGQLAQLLQQEDLGEVLPDGAHLLVPLDAVRRMAAGRVGPGWEQDFESMVAYAQRKGWLSEDGARVRVHLETEPV